jgi:hypothetical protein
MSLRGLLLKESLVDDSALDLVRVISTELSRIEDAVPPQPRWWTIVRFEADAQGADAILQRFSAALKPSWYLHWRRIFPNTPTRIKGRSSKRSPRSAPSSTTPADTKTTSSFSLRRSR